jgi:hypothetical protein
MRARGLDRRRGDQRLVLAVLALTDRARLKHTDLVPVFHR